MSRTIYNVALPLLQRSEQTSPRLITESDLSSVPDVVQRYLRYAQVPGKAAIRTVHLKQEGYFRPGEDQKWMSMAAEQYYTTQPPAFLWRGLIKPNPLMWISGWDRFAEGHGNLSVKLLSLITLASARGPESDQSELLRYLTEIIWFPTAWLSEYIRWEGIDDHSARATIKQGDVQVSAVLYFNEQNQLTRMVADRYRMAEGINVLTQWVTLGKDYREVNGLRIPFKAEALWKLDTGDFSYFQCDLTEIEYT